MAAGRLWSRDYRAATLAQARASRPGRPPADRADRAATTAARRRSSCWRCRPRTRPRWWPRPRSAGRAAAVRGSLLCALYIAAVLVVLAAGRLHRLRICLRVSDQAGRILVATAVPGAGPARLAARGRRARAGAVVGRAGHRLPRPAVRGAARGASPWPAHRAGRGGRGRHVRRLPRRADAASIPSSACGRWACSTTARPGWTCRCRRWAARPTWPTWSAGWASAGSSCASPRPCRDEDLVTVMRASRPLRADVYVVPRLYELGMAVPRGCLDEIWGIPLIPLRGSGRRVAALALKRVLDVVISAVSARGGGAADARPGGRGPAAHRPAGPVPPGQGDRPRDRSRRS